MRPDLDCAWVELRAVVTGTSIDRWGALFFEFVADGFPFSAYVSRGERFGTPPWDLVEREVQVRCAVATYFNDQRQMCGRKLFIPGLSSLTPVDAGPKSGPAPLRLTSEMLRATSPPRELLRLEGTVTMTVPGAGLTLRDAAGSAFVQTAQPLEVAVGDVVEARGYPGLADFRPRLNAVEVRKLRAGAAPPPVAFHSRPPHSTGLEQELVSIDATLSDMLLTPEAITLRCVSDAGEKFDARYPATLLPRVEAGARLRLTGICELLTLGSRARRPDAFRLRLRTPGDLALLQAAPWLNVQRAAWLLGALGAAALLAAAWVVALRREVRAQAAVIRQQAGSVATWEERQRIARELHDTLEQDLMGVTLLLDSTAERLHANPGAAAEQLSIARQLLRRSREESRSTIRDLRSVALEQLGLPAALDETLRPIAEAAGLRFSLEVTGEPRRLAATAENHLLRIAHEGVSNAVKHARATSVALRLAYEREAVALEIRDDGQGGEAAGGGASGNGFGLQGIRERVNKLGGTLRIESPPGEGTRLHVTAPAPGGVAPFA